MRMVHEVEGEMQVGCTGTAYTRALGKTEYEGYRVDLVIAPAPDGEGYADPEDIIHIEGNARYIIPMLESALEATRLIEDSAKEEFNKTLPVAEEICWNRWQEAKAFVDLVQRKLAQRKADDEESSELLLVDTAIAQALDEREADWRAYGTADKRLGETGK